MKRSMLLVVFLVILSAMVLTACGGGGGNGEGNDGGDQMARAEVPAPYAGQTNPFEGDPAAAQAGATTYETYCASCHGSTGQGDGPAGGSLDPKPADLGETAAATGADYLHWVIAEGGPAAGLSPSMAAYKDILSDEEIWQVVAHIQQDFQ